MEKEYKLAVFVGRFQPFHNSHLEVVKHGLEIADQVLIIVGSSHAARSIKNPFSFQERKVMIEAACGDRFSHQEQENKNWHPRIWVEPVRDYYYNNDIWVANVQALVGKYSQDGDSVALIGCYKDGSSFYLDSFPQYARELVGAGNVHGSDIRETIWQAAKNEHGHIMPIFDGTIKMDAKNLLPVAAAVPSSVFRFISEFSTTSKFTDLAKEAKFIADYKAAWSSAPFPPMFVTTDAVVTCSGHVLVVERKVNPGKGLFALPGGFLKAGESIKKGALRELREETRIGVDQLILESQIVGENVFDHPHRSLRGRTISHGFHIKLRDGRLPEVRGGDDAKKAFWMPLWDVVKNEDKFFEDHAHIINYFTGVQ